MKTKAILVELINYLEEYERDNYSANHPLNTTDFIGFLNAKHEHLSVKRDKISGGMDDWGEENDYENGPKTDISILVVMLFRYVKGYVKKALKNSCIKSADDFSFMITLLTYDSMTKMELVNMQAMEKTSGNEIINRLFRLGLINQREDEKDKRSVRVSISDKGRGELFAVLKDMKMVSEIATGDLSQNEINTLAYLLRKLDIYHKDIFDNKRNLNLNEILKNNLHKEQK